MWSGTGWALNDGYVVTNHHVVDGARTILVYGVGGSRSPLIAETIGVDANNDLAIIKITDDAFTGFQAIPYALRTSQAEVGEGCVAMGYPMSQYLGDELKITNGIISSRTGFQGDASTYQMSVPVNHGNSGGPLFDNRGNVIGIVSSGFEDVELCNYAVKSSFLYSLAETLGVEKSIPTKNTLNTTDLPSIVKGVRSFVFQIICSDSATSKASTTATATNTSSANAEMPSSLYGSTSTLSHELVDLGLSVKWAKCDLGAERPENYGIKVSWGETEIKTDWAWSNYSFCYGGSPDIITKYCNDRMRGTLDNLTTLKETDDVARQLLGQGWRIPTAEEFTELFDNCTWTFITIFGVTGYKVQSNIQGYQDNWIFLPLDATNGALGPTLGIYWTSSLNTEDCRSAFVFKYTEKQQTTATGSRYYGFRIRPVCTK